MNKIFDNVDIFDLAIILAFLFFIVTGTLGIVNIDFIDDVKSWVGIILAYLVGKKTPSTITKDLPTILAKK